MTATPDPVILLSLVLPVHNGAGFIERNVDTIVSTLEASGISFEVVVVSDGCTDATLSLVEAIDDPRIRAIGYDANVGKGHAIVCGLSDVRGRFVGWLDADLDIAPDVIVNAVRLIAAAEVDAVIGSKRHPDSVVTYPAIRRLYSWGYQILVRILFRFSATDTQVGAKVFRREMIETVRPLLLIKRYAFDVEVLAVGAEFGFDRVADVPVQLEYRFTGTGIDRRAVLRMLTDTLAIAYRIHIRHWYVRRFAAVQRLRMEERAAALRAAPELISGRRPTS